MAQEDSSRLEASQQGEVVSESPSAKRLYPSAYAPGTEHLKPWQYKAGETGNPDGGSRRRTVSYQQLAADVDAEAKRRMVLALVRKAEKGDVRAFEELANRAEGKPATRIIVTQTDAESPLVSALQRIASRIAQAEGVLREPQDERDVSRETITIEGESRLLEQSADSSGVSEDR